MRRLYLQIYLTVFASLLLFGLLATAVWILVPQQEQDRRLLDGVRQVLNKVLPSPGQSVRELQAMLDTLADALPLQLTVRATDGSTLASTATVLPLIQDYEEGWQIRRNKITFRLRLTDGRWLLGEYQQERHPSGLLLWLCLLAIAIALAAYPVVRRITGRLERLQTRVEQLGKGDFSARVAVEGQDEVAQLADCFNQAATRIQALIEAQKSLLANASHELRSPLTRLRMATELLAATAHPELRRQLERDIQELDELIGELLLASRLDALPAMERSETVDLLGLLAEEAAHFQAEVEGQPVLIAGDPRLLRRLIRNLLENARRYGGGTMIETATGPSHDGGVWLTVADRGPGIAANEQERIFEPFYRPAGSAENTSGSVGLGLALVRSIARHHGGEVYCQARAGGGSCFTVRLNRTTWSHSPDDG